jgi:hypothetical protein
MTDDKKPERDERTSQSQAEDQLSPNRALRESVGRAGGQRVGNNEPIANPTVSFPEGSTDTNSERPPPDGEC